MKVTYDPNHDAGYVYLADIPPGGVAQAVAVHRPGGELVLDFSPDGQLVGIEVLGVTAVCPALIVLARS